MFGALYPGQGYFGQGYPGDQSGVVFAFADVRETTIGRTAGVRTVSSAQVDRTVGRPLGVRTIGDTT